MPGITNRIKKISAEFDRMQSGHKEKYPRPSRERILEVEALVKAPRQEVKGLNVEQVTSIREELDRARDWVQFDAVMRKFFDMH